MDFLKFVHTLHFPPRYEIFDGFLSFLDASTWRRIVVFSRTNNINFVGFVVRLVRFSIVLVHVFPSRVAQSKVLTRRRRFRLYEFSFI
jgi:hypothetical protein